MRRHGRRSGKKGSHLKVPLALLFLVSLLENIVLKTNFALNNLN